MNAKLVEVGLRSSSGGGYFNDFIVDNFYKMLPLVTAKEFSIDPYAMQAGLEQPPIMFENNNMTKIHSEKEQFVSKQDEVVKDLEQAVLSQD